MRVLIVHPVMNFLGGGERLCCETIHALLSFGHEVTLLSEIFDTQRTERFFGYSGLFDRVIPLFYPSTRKVGSLGSSAHLIRHLRSQEHRLRELSNFQHHAFDLVFSTQDAGYIPDMKLPVIQWGYSPRFFLSPLHADSPRALASAIRWLPLRLHYLRKVSRIGLVLAISQYSKTHLDEVWKRPSALVYPGCNMVNPGPKRNLVITVARAVPVKRLELFWKVAMLRPKYEFAMLVTQDPNFLEYSIALSRVAPMNGRILFNPSKDTYHKFLGEAKVYLHMMEREHFGISIVEAMSAMCTPIVHDSGGPKEIVCGRAGLRWQTIDEVPSMIDEAMRNAPSAAARQRAQCFSIERFEKRLASIFSQMRV